MLMFSSQHGMSGMAPALNGFGYPFQHQPSLPVSPAPSPGAIVFSAGATIPQAGAVVATANGPVAITLPSPTDPGAVPTAAVDDGTIFGLSPLAWGMVGVAGYIAWKFFSKPK